MPRRRRLRSPRANVPARGVPLEGDQPTSFERLRSPANLIKSKSHGIRQFLEANTAVDATVLVNPACDFAQDREVTARPDVVQLRRAHGRLSEIGAEAGRQPLSSHDWGLRELARLGPARSRGL